MEYLVRKAGFPVGGMSNVQQGISNLELQFLVDRGNTLRPDGLRGSASFSTGCYDVFRSAFEFASHRTVTRVWIEANRTTATNPIPPEESQSILGP